MVECHECDVESRITKMLNHKPLGKLIGISTYEICRKLNAVKYRAYCSKHRREYKREDKPKYKGTRDPTGDCSNDVLKNCTVSFRQTYKALRKLEKNGDIFSLRARGKDHKRFKNYFQVTTDTFRFWFLTVELSEDEIVG